MPYQPHLPLSLRNLLDRRVIVPAPEQVFIDESVMPERIAPGVTLHPGVRLYGSETTIGPGCVLGEEGPVTLDNCQLSHDVSLKGGYFSGAVFLDGASMGSGAHVRPGTILAEEASGAHSVGLKQTILLPFVTLGSLVNFCDCLMSGGTSRRNHSEVGSSYIHFNFTPHGDKATPSLIGDVPRGVMLDQAPIFLGGQGGLVGPARVTFGVVVAAGGILRKDALEPGLLHVPTMPEPSEPKPYVLGRYGAVDRLVRTNLIYIGNVRALQIWYRFVRYRMMHRDPYREACRLGALQQLDAVMKERIRRLQDVAQKMPASIERLLAEPGVDQADLRVQQQRKLHARWPAIREALKGAVASSVGAAARDVFMPAWDQLDQLDYVESLRSLPADIREAGVAWLQAVVDETVAIWDRT